MKTRLYFFTLILFSFSVVTMGKGGLMYEASVGGQKFKVEKY